jgi:hypothetical protein
MANKIELRNLVTDLLNSNVIDAYPSNLTRNGHHFYDESDGINLSRGDTFPKGFVTLAVSPVPILQNIGKSGHMKKYGSIQIFYYTKEKQSFINNGTTYSNEDLINFMLEQIQTALVNTRLHDYHLFPTSITTNNRIRQIKTGNFKVYMGSITVTYYWNEIYG